MNRIRLTCLLICYLAALNALAGVDKVYHPYVEQQSTEIEARLISQLDSELAASFSVYRFGYGGDVLDNLFVEFYLIGNKNSQQNVEIEAYEVEALYQFTEQGEYWADVGMLFEVERERENREWEGNIALLVEKEFGRWSAALNVHQKYEYIDDVRHEWEREQAFQLRYRMQPSFEPGIEFFADESSVFIGPVMLGEVKFAKSKLSWEVGIAQQINRNENDSILRGVVEFEF